MSEWEPIENAPYELDLILGWSSVSGFHVYYRSLGGQWCVAYEKDAGEPEYWTFLPAPPSAA